MSADLDRLVADAQASGWIAVTFEELSRIAADHEKVVAERDELRSLDRFIEETDALVADRDRWRAIADRLGEALDDVWASDDSAERHAALDAWRAAKEAIAHTKVEPLSPDPNWHYDQDQMNDLERDD